MHASPLCSRVLSALLLVAGAARAEEPAAPAPTEKPAAAAEGPAWVSRYLELFQSRDKEASLGEMFNLVNTEVAVNPKSYEGHWRLAELYCWQANGLPDGNEDKAVLGKRCWDEGEKALELNDKDVKGFYWATVGMGLYSEGLGVIAALSQGIEGKFKARVQKAIALDKDYLMGGPTMLFGRFYWKLPWPKRDKEKSIELLRDTVKRHPKNLRALLFLADSLESDGKEKEARGLAEQVAKAPIGTDGPDDRRNKAAAEAWLKAH